MELEFGFVCDRGLNPRRRVNQDRVLTVPQRGLFAVFDGVGGQRAGEVASQTAAETIEEALAQSPTDRPAEMVRRAVQFANRDIYELASGNPEFRSMATTVALIYINGDRATIAHVGDSRVYRLQKGRLYRETIDHTDLNDEVRAGRITQAEAAWRDNGNVINRALGVDPDVDVEVRSIRLTGSARFLLCSDGVYKHVTDEQIARELALNEDAQRAADELKRLVYAAGADDNLTAVVVQVGRAVSSATAEVAAVAATASRPAASDQPTRGRTQSGGGRIRVEFNSGAQAGRDESGERAAGAGDQRGASGSFTRLLMYGLLGLVLMAGAFYAGLRTSDRFKPRTSDQRGLDATGDALRAGREAFEAGNYQSAAAQFDSLIRRESHNAEAHYWLGRAQLEARRYKEAAQSLERAIELQPSMGDAYLQAAAAYEAEGIRDRAEKMLRQYGEEKRKGNAGTQRQ